MAQHTRANSSGRDCAIHLHLRDLNHSSEDNNINILAKQDKQFERGVKESISVKLSLNRGDGLRHYISPTYNAVLGVPSPDS